MVSQWISRRLGKASQPIEMTWCKAKWSIWALDLLAPNCWSSKKTHSHGHILDTIDLFCSWHSLWMFMQFDFLFYLPLVGHWLARCEDRNLFRPSCAQKEPEHPALFVSFLWRLRWRQNELDWQIRLGFFAEILDEQFHLLAQAGNGAAMPRLCKF